MERCGGSAVGVMAVGAAAVGRSGQQRDRRDQATPNLMRGTHVGAVGVSGAAAMVQDQVDGNTTADRVHSARKLYIGDDNNGAEHSGQRKGASHRSYRSFYFPFQKL